MSRQNVAQYYYNLGAQQAARNILSGQEKTAFKLPGKLGLGLAGLAASPMALNAMPGAGRALSGAGRALSGALSHLPESAIGAGQLDIIKALLAGEGGAALTGLKSMPQMAMLDYGAAKSGLGAAKDSILEYLASIGAGG